MMIRWVSRKFYQLKSGAVSSFSLFLFASFFLLDMIPWLKAFRVSYDRRTVNLAQKARGGPRVRGETSQPGGIYMLQEFIRRASAALDLGSF